MKTASDEKTSNGLRIIIPPPDVRELLHVTASWLATRPGFENRIRKEHENDPRFSFLNPSDPYHAYFQQRIEESKNLKDEGESSTKPVGHTNSLTQEKSDKENKTKHPSNSNSPLNGSHGDEQKTSDNNNNTTAATAIVSLLKSNRAKKAKTRPEPKEPPPNDKYTVIDVTPTPSVFAISVIKLAAEFGARFGPDFLNSLASREARNPLFDFLKPLHPHFILFQRLRDAYVAILDEGEEKARTIEKLKAYSDSFDVVLDDVWYMHDWECQKAEREHDATLAKDEIRKGNEVDWYDFVVLETVHISETDENLPAPVRDVKQLPMILAAANKAKIEREKNRGDIDMDIDMETTQQNDTAVETANVDSDIPSDRIRHNVPNNGASRRSTATTVQERTVILPSGQKVPLSQAEASMRAELLDPSYKDEQARAAQKNKLQNLAMGDEVARNLARLDQTRTEGNVYNRGDLQAELASMAKPSLVEADARIKKAVPAGPRLPSEQDGNNISGPPAKKARVEAAVNVLSKSSTKDESKVDQEVDVSVTDPTPSIPETLPGLLPAEEWIKKQGDVARVRIKLPPSVSKDQEIEMSAPLKKLVESLKAGIAKFTKLPAKKQKLHIEGMGFLKDKMSLAYYNIGDGTRIVLEVKERGGRKKR